MKSRLTCVLTITKMSRPLLVAMVLLCSTLGLAQANGNGRNTTEVQALSLTGGTMTGPIHGNVDYTFADFGHLSGGLRLLDEKGNAIQTGHSAAQGNIILLTTPGGANVSVSDLRTGTLAFSDNTGNGVIVGGGQTVVRNGGNWITVDSLGVRVTSLAVYRNNAAAIAGGLVAGNLYRIGTDPDVVCVVH